jgi:hypothetical protein
MDPLTIGSAVVGLIAAASRIGPIVYHFVTHAHDVPKTASQILDEMNSVTAALERLQVYVIGASKTKVARRSLLSLKNIIATLIGCVTTYSDLEIVVGKCVEDEKVKRVRWLINEKDIEDLVLRVQSHKLSLTLMLTILQWCVLFIHFTLLSAQSDMGSESMQEAESAMDRLIGLVEGLVASNTDVRLRIDPLATDYVAGEGVQELPDQEGHMSSSHLGSAYETDLSTSRPYRKLRQRDSIWSIATSQQKSMATSAFSDLTLDNVSRLSVLCLPVWSEDLSNAEHYHFGEGGTTKAPPKKLEEKPLFSMKKFYKNFTQTRDVRPTDNLGASRNPEEVVLTYSNQFITMALKHWVPKYKKTWIVGMVRRDVFAFTTRELTTNARSRLRNTIDMYRRGAPPITCYVVTADMWKGQPKLVKDPETWDPEIESMVKTGSPLGIVARDVYNWKIPEHIVLDNSDVLFLAASLADVKETLESWTSMSVEKSRLHLGTTVGEVSAFLVATVRTQ